MHAPLEGTETAYYGREPANWQAYVVEALHSGTESSTSSAKRASPLNCQSLDCLMSPDPLELVEL